MYQLADVRETESPGFSEGVISNYRFAKGQLMQVYVYSCEACDVTVVDSSQYSGLPLNPGIDGWYAIEQLWYCPAHKLVQEIFVDDVRIKTVKLR